MAQMKSVRMSKTQTSRKHERQMCSCKGEEASASKDCVERTDNPFR